MSGVVQITDIRTIYRSILLFIFLIMSVCLNAQTEKKYIRQGNREYDKGKYSESEIFYRKATDKNNQSPDAVFNTGDALYKQNKFEEAGNQFVESINETNDKIKKSAGFFNLGNSLLKANKIQESIEAYKNSLMLRPDNPEAKFNLAYAQEELKKQQKQQQQQQQQNKDQQNKDNKKNDKNKQDQNKDKNDNKDQNNDQNKDQDNKQTQNQNQDDKQQQSDKQQISQEDAQRLLNSMANDEKKVQEKVKLAKATKAKTRSVKNW